MDEEDSGVREVQAEYGEEDHAAVEHVEVALYGDDVSREAVDEFECAIYGAEADN
jgi:hypothetical protein